MVNKGGGGGCTDFYQGLFAIHKHNTLIIKMAFFKDEKGNYNFFQQFCQKIARTNSVKEIIYEKYTFSIGFHVNCNRQ